MKDKSVVGGNQDSKLLKLIKMEIERSGGANNMGFNITHFEAPEWFSESTRTHFKWELNYENYHKKERHEISGVKTWKPNELKLMVKMWSRYRLKDIAFVLERSTDSVRQKAKNYMAKEQYENRAYNKLRDEM